MIGVLVGDLGNAYHAHLAQVVERALFRQGHTTVFCNIEGDEELAIAGVDALLEQRVAGFVLLALIERTPQLAESLRRTDIPMVAIGLRQEWTDSVGPNDREGGRLATQHLVDLGHRRIGYVRTAMVEASGDRARHAGYVEAVRKAGVEPTAGAVVAAGSDTIRVGRSAVPLARALRGPEAPTAVFVWNDFGAIGLIEACEEAGIDGSRRPVGGRVRRHRDGVASAGSRSRRSPSRSTSRPRRRWRCCSIGSTDRRRPRRST